MKRAYGWKKDPEDNRDKLFKLHRIHPERLPAVVDLSEGISQVYDQGNLGSCTGHGVGSLDRYVTERQKMTPFEPSRLFIYYEARKRINKEKVDSGAHIRDAMKVISKKGVCNEAYWPYDVRRFREQPSKQAYDEAETHQAVEYQRVSNNLYETRNCLAEGFPFVFGMQVYPYFESPEMGKSGILKMPADGEKSIGGHCVLCVGYNDEKQTFKILNSWGEDWGQGGFFEMPYEYMIKFCSDLWTLKVVE